MFYRAYSGSQNPPPLGAAVVWGRIAIKVERQNVSDYGNGNIPLVLTALSAWLCLLGLCLAKRACQRREAVARMEYRLGDDGDENHPPLEGDEIGFIPHQVVGPALDQLGNSVDATDQDA